MTALWVFGALASAFALIKLLDWYMGRRVPPCCDDDTSDVLRSANDMTSKVDDFMRQIGATV